MTNGINPYNPYDPLKKQPNKFQGVPSSHAVMNNAQSAEEGDSFIQSFMEMPYEMGIPRDAKEAKEAAPYIAGGFGFSYGLAKLISWLTSGKGGENINYADTRLVKLQQKIDKIPGVKQLSGMIDNIGKGLKGAGSKMPTSLQDLGKSFKEAASPTNVMARGMYEGTKGFGVDALMDSLKENFSEFDDVFKKQIKNGRITQAEYNKLVSALDDIKIGKVHARDAYETVKGTIHKIPSSEFKTVKIPRKGISKIFGPKKIKLNMVLNKVKAADMVSAAVKTGAKPSVISRALSKVTMTLGEALSGDFLGGKIGIIINSFMIYASLHEAKKAKEGEKVSKFMEDFLGNWIAGFVMMPLALKMLYKPAGALKLWGSEIKGKDFRQQVKYMKESNTFINKLGAKNATITDDVIKDIAKKCDISEDLLKGKSPKEIQKLLIETSTNRANVLQKAKNISGLKKTKIGSNLTSQIANTTGVAEDSLKGQTGKQVLKTLKKAKVGKDEIKAAKKLLGSNKSLLQKLLSIPGRILSVGLDNIPSIAKTAGGLKGKFGNALKKMGGYGRFIVIMMSILPIFTKTAMKISHKIFGKPSNSELDELEGKEETKSINSPVTPQQAVATTPNVFKNVVNKNSQSSYVKDFLKENTGAQAAAQLNTEEKPNALLGLGKKKIKEPKRKYVPSPEAARFNSDQVSDMDRALSKSEAQVAYAERMMNKLNKM